MIDKIEDRASSQDNLIDANKEDEVVTDKKEANVLKGAITDSNEALDNNGKDEIGSNQKLKGTVPQGSKKSKKAAKNLPVNANSANRPNADLDYLNSQLANHDTKSHKNPNDASEKHKNKSLDFMDAARNHCSAIKEVIYLLNLIPTVTKLPDEGNDNVAYRIEIESDRIETVATVYIVYDEKTHSVLFALTQGNNVDDYSNINDLFEEIKQLYSAPR